jgi:hypothetical protein
MLLGIWIGLTIVCFIFGLILYNDSHVEAYERVGVGAIILSVLAALWGVHCACINASVTPKEFEIESTVEVFVSSSNPSKTISMAYATNVPKSHLNDYLELNKKAKLDNGNLKIYVSELFPDTKPKRVKVVVYSNYYGGIDFPDVLEVYSVPELPENVVF